MVGRRDFIKGAIAVLFSYLFADIAASAEKDDSADDLKKMHAPEIKMPKVAQDGKVVPITIDLPDHPMKEDHYIKSIEISDSKSATPVKGTVILTPDVGRAFLSTRLKMSDGEHRVKVTIECSRHGRFEDSVAVKVAGGGCKEV